MSNRDEIRKYSNLLTLDVLQILLADRTTGKFIKWATDNYVEYGFDCYANADMSPVFITNHLKIIVPRVLKEQEEQTKRTRDRAEVFTPSWICNEQNNLIDEAWFGSKDIFNTTLVKSWSVKREKIIFPQGKDWKQYVDLKRLEISCGEAPYLVSRYDSVTGTYIEIDNRIGLLDRKLRVICENVDAEDEWYSWVKRAFQGIYGYEYQGDNLLLARENLLYSFIEYMVYKFGKKPEKKQIKEIAKIISWNIWQMDGLSMTAPYSEAEPVFQQISLSDFFGDETLKNDDEFEFDKHENALPCRIYDWRSNCSLEYRTMVNGER